MKTLIWKKTMVLVLAQMALPVYAQTTPVGQERQPEKSYCEQEPGDSVCVFERGMNFTADGVIDQAVCDAVVGYISDGDPDNFERFFTVVDIKHPETVDVDVFAACYAWGAYDFEKPSTTSGGEGESVDDRPALELNLGTLLQRVRTRIAMIQRMLKENKGDLDTLRSELRKLEEEEARLLKALGVPADKVNKRYQLSDAEQPPVAKDDQPGWCSRNRGWCTVVVIGVTVAAVGVGFGIAAAAGAFSADTVTVAGPAMLALPP